MAKILNLYAGELRQSHSDRIWVVTLGKFDCELVNGSSSIPFENVDTDEIAAEFPDLGGDLTE